MNLQRRNWVLSSLAMGLTLGLPQIGPSPTGQTNPYELFQLARQAVAVIFLFTSLKTE